MNFSSRVQIQAGAVYFSLHADTLDKGMNPTLHFIG